MAHEFVSETDTASASNAGQTAASSVQQAAQHSAPELSREEQVAELDAKADRKGIMILFGAAMLFVLHFISGWTFDWTYNLF